MKLILAETHYWDSAPRVDSHHLALHLARRGHEILYLSSPASIFHLLQRKNWHHKWRRLTRYCGMGQVIIPNLRAIVPLTWAPVQARYPLDSPAQLRRSLAWTTPSLRKTIHKLGFASPDALLIQSLFFANLPDWFPDTPVLYRMTDDFDAFPGMPRALVQAEAPLVQRAELVTVCSEFLIARAKAMRAKRIELLPHGVDIDLFEQPLKTSSPASDRPRVIYVGAIDSWFRADCVAEAARRLPQVDFEIAGPVGAADLSALANMPNVRMVGPVPFAQVPQFMHGAKVGIIPFKRTPLIEPVRPLKLFEYLAAGLNVVATRWTELESVQKLWCKPLASSDTPELWCRLPACSDAQAPLILADSAQEFASAVERALHEPSSDAGRQFASENSWSRRADELEAMIRSISRIVGCR